MDKLKKYVIHIILFIIAASVYLPMRYTLSNADDYSYFFGAISLLKNHAYLVHGNPVTYPLGYPLLIVPFLFLFGINVQSAVLPCAIFGSLSVVLLYELTKDLLDRRAALFASAFFLFSSHWSMSTVLMSDAPALFFMLLSIYAFVKYLHTQKSLFIYLFYSALGFACLIRYLSLLVPIILVVYLVFRRKTHILGKKEVWWGMPIFLVILSPQIIYNYVYFKHPLQTGYHTLHEGSYHGLKLFSLKYFYTSGLRRPPYQIIEYLKYIIAGFGTPVFPFAIYGLWNWIKQRKHQLLSLIIPWLAVPVMALSFYFGPQLRYIILSFPALFVLAGQGFSSIYDTSIIRNEKVKKLFVSLLVIILLLPTMIFWFDMNQKRETNRRCQREVFHWIRQNSEQDDIIISFKEPSYEYHSRRKVYGFDRSIEELEKILSAHSRSFFVVHETWRNQDFIAGLSDTEKWLNKAYGLIYLRTFECKPEISTVSKIAHRISDKIGVPSLPLQNVWKIYLIINKI